MVHPEAAWSRGITGQGVTIAIIDEGVEQGTHDLDPNLSSQSTDVVGTRNTPYRMSDAKHATMVADFAAAAFDNRGTVGVAYNATILSIRSDSIGSCTPTPDDCTFNDSNLTLALDYASTHGAKVANMSLGGDTAQSGNFVAALGRAVSAGMVVVAAAGNTPDSGPSAAAANCSAANIANTPCSPGWPARYATQPGFNGQIIAVGALNAAGTDIADYSYRAGVAQDFYLLAPGTDVVSGCGIPDTGGVPSCWIGDGTSFATPVVSGAAALLFSGFPNLTAHDVVDILLRSARDLGAPGTDPIYGRGALDISRAFQPLGPLNVPNATGFTAISDDNGPGASGSLAFGDSLVRSNALGTVGYDDYHRLFRINLGDAYHNASPKQLAVAGGPAIAQGGITVSMPDGGRLQVAALANSDFDRPTGTLGLTDRTGDLLNISASYDKGPIHFDLWTGQPGLSPTFDGSPVDDFSALAGSSKAARAGYTVGRWTFAAEGGGGNKSLGDEFAMAGTVRANEESDSRYAKLMATFRDRYVSTTVGVGQLDERGGPLGAFAPRDSDLAMPAISRFVTLKSEWAAKPGLLLSAEGALGHTDAEGRLLKLRDGVSSTWRLRGVADCSLIGISCTAMAVELSQPVRIEKGTVTAYLADQPADYFAPLTYSSRTLELSPSGRELDLRVSAWRPLGPGQLRLDATAITNEWNRADSPLNFGFTAGWRARF